MAFRDLIPGKKPGNRAHARHLRSIPDLAPGDEPSVRRCLPWLRQRKSVVAMEGRFGWPKVELTDGEKTLTISAELPGMTEKDVQVEIARGILTIRGEKKAERNGEGRYFTERYYGAFERQIPLDDVQEDKAEASFKNGVLTISFPKSDKPREGVKRIARAAPASTAHP
ncbi:HSP20 family molecular chaperone IbpA [Bradyrhizobium sp. USDA 4529]